LSFILKTFIFFFFKKKKMENQQQQTVIAMVFHDTGESSLISVTSD